MTNLVEHARRELNLCGQTEEDPAYAASVVGAIAVLASFGHSGGSLFAAVDQLVALLRFEHLSPLTDDPFEWEDRSEISGAPMWQSLRNPAAFSVDGGRTYYLTTEAGNADSPHPIHTSASSIRAPQEDPVPLTGLTNTDERFDYARKTARGRSLEPTADHLTLLRRAWWDWYDCEYGAPAIDPKRPYGNSDVDGDLAELLPHLSAEDRARIHCELPAVLNHLCSNLPPATPNNTAEETR